MALVNPNIAMSYRGIELPQQNALADYAAIQQIQGGRQAQELNALKMQEAQRTAKSQNVLADAYAQATDPATGKIDYNKLTGLVAAGGGGAQLPGIQKLRTEQSAAETKLQKDQADLLDSKLKQSRSFLDTLDPSDPAAPDRYIAWHEANHKDPIIGAALTARGITADQSRAQIMAAIAKGPAAFAQLLNQSKLGTEKFMEMNKPTLTPQTLGGTTRLISTPGLGGVATPVEGSVGTVTMTPAQEREAKDSAIRIKQEGQRIGLEGRRVAVLEQDAKQKQDPVFQQAMAGARATGEAIAKGTVAAQQALPGVITNAMIAVNAVDDMIGRQAVKDASGKVIQPATAPHKGFQDAVGATWKPGFRFIPGTDASDFQSYQDQIEGAAFLSAFEALKGGGAISEKEGSKATAAKLRMKLAQSEVEYIKAAREFQEVVRTGVENARRKFGAGGAAPAAGGANIDALLDKYK